MNAIYEVAAKAAYTNSLELLDEAKILFQHSKFPRAYSLCILSMEEFSKSFLYKCFESGIISREDLRRGCRNHGEKISHSVHLLLTGYIFWMNRHHLTCSINEDKGEPDHRNHIFPSVLLEAIVQEMLSETVLGIFGGSEDLKLKALYVDVVDEQLSLPNEVISMEQSKRVLDFMDEGVQGFDIILDSESETFRKMVEWLDPQVVGR